HVGGVETSGEDDFHFRRSGGFRPVEGSARAAVAAGWCVQQDCFGWVLVESGQVELLVYLDCLPDSEIGEAGRLPYNLRNVESEPAGDGGHAVRRLVDEDTDFPDGCGQLRDQLGGAVGRQIAWTGRIKVEPERRGAAVDGSQRVFPVGNTADFHDHPGTALRVRRAAAGSGALMRLSPTRNASKPASRRICTSSAE